ncbi:MAG: hypothetical protein M3544_15200 [Pseudomonadota bacterium]|nr:hypothetical protein [Pseudomonadota bacterium]
MQSAPPPNKDLSDWLQEVGKRRFSRQSGHVEVPTPPRQVETPVQPEPPRPAERRPTGKWLAISAVAAVAYLQFFYADVLLQIAKAPAIIFFVLVNGQLPPL